jgi:hypothetical protein
MSIAGKAQITAGTGCFSHLYDVHTKNWSSNSYYDITVSARAKASRKLSNVHIGRLSDEKKINYLELLLGSR